MRRSPAVFGLALLPWGGCIAQSDCLEDTRSLAPDEDTAFHVSTREALEAVSLTGLRPLSWYATKGILGFEGRGTETQVHWTLEPDLNSARFVESRENPKNKNANVKECFDRIEVDGTLRISTDDGWLDEAMIPSAAQFTARDGDPPAGITWTLPQLEISIDTLAGALPEGLEAGDGDHFFYARGWSGFDGSESLEIAVWTHLEDHNGVAIGETKLGCYSTLEDMCAEPQ